MAFGISFAILAGGVYLTVTKGASGTAAKAGKQEDKQDFKPIDLSKLDDMEKKIYGLLQQQEGSMYQSELAKETALSKVQVTRVLDKMESKGILGRQRRGMTNIVILK